ncbi:MAG: hypothetical protein KF689_04475 [Gemmatimonadaceae bacterium]|nr:hypothetical protein [Gemmatimonadaceae bacterium]MCW5825573.1 hypothetical protein [Gemmatimonadaceae bacterium]
MLCAVCNKESKNQRVCPYCFTPYPAEGPSAKRPTRASPVANSGSAAGAAGPSLIDGLREKAEEARAWFLRQTPTVRYTSAAILAVLLLMWLTRSEPQFEAGVVQSEIIATPLERDEALATIRSTRETALVDIQQDEVFVTYSAATFPVREEGQLALVQLFTRADEIVEGRKRRIYFYNPNGKMFAQADGVRGVVLVR